MIHHIGKEQITGKNATPAIVAAVRQLEEGDTLLLDKGTYHLYPDGAEIKEYYISNNDGGTKPVAFPLIGKKSVTIDGGGSELIFHGHILPFAIDHSENLIVKNLSIDYHHPLYAQAEILESDERHCVLRFDGKEFFCRVDEEGHFGYYSKEDGWEFSALRHNLSLEFSPDGIPLYNGRPYFAYCGEPCDHGFLSRMFRHVTLEEKEKNVIVMHGENLVVHTPGNYLIMTYSTREYPGIFVTDSHNVTLSDIHLYHTASMGVIAQTTENITLRHIVAEPRQGSGRLLSVAADATHFVNCRGKITMSDCKFVQMMDDACNIHGIYNLYQKREAPDTLLLGFGHHQQMGVQTYREGDRVAIIDSTVNEIRAEATVRKAELLSPDRIRLTLDREVDAPGEHWVVENLSTAPDVHIHDCESGHNRPRGFLLSSGGKILIERCKFYNMNQGIQLSGEMRDWYESGAVRDVTIRDCDFENSAYAGGVAIVCSPALRATEFDGSFNGQIVVEHNRFTQAEKRLTSIRLADRVVFRGNTFHKDPTLPPHKPHREEGVSFTQCGTVEYEPVKEI